MKHNKVIFRTNNNEIVIFDHKVETDIENNIRLHVQTLEFDPINPRYINYPEINSYILVDTNIEDLTEKYKKFKTW